MPHVATGQASSAAPAERSWKGLIQPDRVLLAIPLAFLAVLLLYPLANTVASSFSGSDPLAHYREVFGDELFVRAALRTLLVSALCTVFCLALAYPLAFEITRPRTRARVGLLAIVVVTFWISTLIRAYSWVIIQSPDGVLNDLLTSLGLIPNPIEFQRGIWGVSIGLTHFLLPYLVLVLIPSLRAVDDGLIAAARSLGATRLQAFARVFLPMTAGGIAAGCLLTFILAIGSFVLPAILAGPAVPFVATIIGDEVGRLQNFDLAATMGVCLTVLVVGIYLLLLRVVDPNEILGGRERE